MLSKHLAAVAHAQTEGVGACKKCLHLLRQNGVEGDAARPTNASTQGVAVAEATASHQTFEVLQLSATGLQVGHVHVVGIKTCFCKRIGHLDV
jgi:hypothetical protein